MFFVFFFQDLFAYLFLAMLHLGCCAPLSLVGASRGYRLVEVSRILIAVVSLVAEHGL